MRKDGVLSSALILAVTTMGAGILTLPSAYSDAGVLLASAMLTLVAFLTVVSIDYIVIAIDTLGVNSYEQINRQLLGKYNEELIRWMLIFYNIGSAISYLIILENLIEPLQPFLFFHVPWLVTTKHILLMFWFVVLLPISCVPDITFLRNASFLGITATCFISSLVVFRYFIPNDNENNNNNNNNKHGGGIHGEYNHNNNNVIMWLVGRQPLLSLPIMMFSFDCQFLVFQVYCCLEHRTRHKMLRVSIISIIISGTIHAAVGMFGYLGNPINVRENVMSSFDPRLDSLFAVGYIVYVIPVILAYVIILLPTRDAIFLMWYGYSSTSEAVGMLQEEHEYIPIHNNSNENNNNNININSGQQRGIPLRDHLIVSISLSVACVTVALVLPGIVSIVALLGGVCSSSLCFTYPALYRYRLHATGVQPCERWWEWPLVWGMLGFGVVGGVVGTIMAVREFF